MRLPHVRFTIREMMIGVVVVALILPPAIYFYCIWRNLKVYGEWASDTSPNRPATYHLPYPAAGRWPY
jgi:hypothetical protein